MLEFDLLGQKSCWVSGEYEMGRVLGDYSVSRVFKLRVEEGMIVRLKTRTEISIHGSDAELIEEHKVVHVVDR